MTEQLPERGDRLRIDGELVTVEVVSATETGADLILRTSSGSLWTERPPGSSWRRREFRKTTDSVTQPRRSLACGANG